MEFLALWTAWPSASTELRTRGGSFLTSSFSSSSEEVLPVGIIAGATIGAGILLTFFFITLVFFLYRRRKGSEYGPRGPPPAPHFFQGPQEAAPPGPRRVTFAFPRPGGYRNSHCRGWQKVSKLSFPDPGRKDVTLRKLDIKVETVNREPLTVHSDREDDTSSISTATRVMKAIYSVRVLFLPGPLPSLYSWDWPHPSFLITTVTRCSLGWLTLVLPDVHMHMFT